MAAKLIYPWGEAPEHGVPREVAPGIEWLRLPLPMALDHVNCWILAERDGSVSVVDTGFATKLTRKLWDKALGGRRVSRVFVTHHHPDHVGLAGWFQQDGAELWMTRVSWLMARMLRLDEQERPTDETVAFWRAGGMDADVLEKRLGERPFNFADVVADMPLGYRRLDEGARVTIGGRDWVVRLGAGHAPDHATFWCAADGLVLGGDQLLPSISPNLGLYATEPGADPVADWLAACARLMAFAHDDQLVLPGHKLPFRGLPFRLRQLIDNHHGALERLLEHLSRPQTAGECFAPLFKRNIGAGEYGLALVEAMAHCQHLHHKGVVSRETRDDGAWVYRAL
ncbi:MBL fold metallo-hydrolase [Maribius pontilimi]|uniref:MBL fold metallo-hydrolase n=1 Tax=Palleronia pontilimi TaxID=1964209 RepID=A0A934I6Z9_9RHOB|nr:MBL fold metallo-hydrolase [Palleronia pontilimi]MBJ3761363.1 MBL fold metallo-hydrolase [Palleronia pontilimi]